MKFNDSRRRPARPGSYQPPRPTQNAKSLPVYSYRPTTPGQSNPKANLVFTPRRKTWKRVLLWLMTITLAITLATGGWVAYKFLANEIRVFGWKGLWGLFHTEKLKGEDGGHVNILLAGNSSDDPEHAGATLTDSIMVLSINTKQNTAFMLSVPRDLYVDIPDDGYAKVNETYQNGEANQFHESGYPDGGMGLMSKVVSDNFGLTLHYYALVDYAAVRGAVDAVGGVEVDIKSPDSRGLYDPSPDLSNNRQPLVKLSNGAHHLNGVQALGLARARGNHYGAYGYGLSDFQRTANQRQIMLGLKNKATSAGTLSNPVKLSQLMDAVGQNVQTDLSLGNVRRLISLLKKIPDNQIKSVGLNDVDGHNLLTSYITRYGQYALVPRAGLDDYSEIQNLIDGLLNSSSH